ncbi:tRNA methyltransferase 10 homolog B isoform X2 [Nematostella vectensis]|uniref:tRNA methyltransferase 10 homolog B isoform X2 n=1 Tax=Nematostella vectensis TaxID=45351 RepID=UPI00207701EF|nr:tRNA methyltransferase 10 homolog B isoform X2 [Nematostella vectensis]
MLMLLTLSFWIASMKLKKVLLHGRVDTKVVDVLDRTSWESVKIIRNSVKIEDVYVEIVCSSVYEAANFLQYTCVQGIAIAEPLLWNPALYSRCRPATLEVMKQYLHLCKHFSTQLLLAKKSMMQFSGYLLRRFPDLHEHVEMADSVQNLAEVAKELEERLSQLTKNQVKMLGRLQEKKLHYRIRALKQKCRNQAKIKKGSTLYEGPTKRQRKEEQKQRVVDAMANGLRVALDLSLVHKMSKKEIGKVAGQVRRVYGSNMKSSRPVHLHFTGLVKSEAIYQECVRQNQGFEQYMVEKTECSLSDVFAADETIYLTPDSPNVLESLDSRMVYVIGGLVDHTVLKNVTKRKAEVCSLKTARLPLDEYMDMVHSGNHNYSRVLSINQVFDILLKFYETKDWRQALLSGVPARKGFTVKAS